MEQLIINGKNITSLEDLRQNFDLSQVMMAFLDKRLETWLEGCFYEREADEVSALEHTLTPVAERALCEALNVSYLDQVQLTQEQREMLERKQAVIARHTNDQELLSHALDTALNQMELAELLEAGRGRIYLCDGSFSVPIRRNGVHYIGIGSPKVNTTFTEEQYRRAGITFEGIELPETLDEKSIADAERAAAQNGYDNFRERHTALATLFHEAMKCQVFSQYHRLNINCGSVSSEFYKSKFEAKDKAHTLINKAYSKASSFFTVSGENSIVPPAAKWYGERLREGVSQLALALAPYCKTRETLSEKHKELMALIDQREDKLLGLFVDELTGSGDYYSMYERSYFLEHIDIEKHDFNVDVFDNDLFNGLARLIHDESEYTVNGLYETIAELEEDVSRLASTFYSEAHERYEEYCKKIEEIAEEIGKDLSGDDMRKLGIASEERSA